MLHLGVAAFHHIHALLVRHGERGDVHHVPHIILNFSDKLYAIKEKVLKQSRITKCN